MRNVMRNKSLEFFDRQFQLQIRQKDFVLNPFEDLALEHLTGTVLDLGSGLGNLSLEAGRRGHHVVAVDGSLAAITRVNTDAQQAALPVRAVQMDLEKWVPDRSYDTIVAIGLLMFFRRERALELLHSILDHVNPGGCVIINVLIEGTTYMNMFDAKNYYLFSQKQLEEEFAGWRILSSRYQTFPAPEGKRKEFATVIAEKPRAVSGAGRLDNEGME
jgi:tellurite methyltransferase